MHENIAALVALNMIITGAIGLVSLRLLVYIRNNMPHRRRIVKKGEKTDAK